MPLKRGVEPGESEFSHGKGQIAPPMRGYVPTQYDLMLAERRTDTTDPGSAVDSISADPYSAKAVGGNDMYHAAGNPDRYGPQKPLVRETKPSPRSNIDVSRPMGVRGAKFRTGVIRGE